jgi:hypothetical protein
MLNFKNKIFFYHEDFNTFNLRTFPLFKDLSQVISNSMISDTKIGLKNEHDKINKINIYFIIAWNTIIPNEIEYHHLPSAERERG